jgi:PIN domain nuclease of toxin-antitoxin system
MNILLDTHILLWFLNDNENLSEKVKSQVENPQNSVLVSIVSLWKISIKINLSKLKLDIPFEQLFHEIENLNIEILNIKREHLIVLKELEFKHRDPFDRLIISQAISENLYVASNDKTFAEYEINLIS